MDRNFMKLL